MHKIIETAVKRPITVFMVIVAIVILGIVCLSRLAIDFYPEIEFPVISISTEYDGAGPQEVEKSVTRLIESAVAGVNGVKTVTSASAEGSSRVTVEFNWGIDLGDATSDIRESLDMIRRMLPDDAGSPSVFKFSTSMIPIMQFVLYGSDDIGALYDLADNQVVSKIEQVNGVARVQIFGGLQKQVIVDVSLNRLQAYGLDINSIVALLARENQNIAGGNTYEGVYKYILRTTGEFKEIVDLENVVVALKGGVPIRLRDVANIYYGYDDNNIIMRVNGTPSVTLSLNKESGENTVAISKSVLKQMDILSRNTLPPGVKFAVVFNSADYINESISGVVSSAVQGAFFAIFVLMIYLWNFRTVGIIGISIPISIVTTFILMYFSGITLNIISLAGLSLGVGMMVDSSIVVLENIFYHKQIGKGKYSAAINGAQEVSLAITASTFTTVAVFIPFLFVEGMTGQIFKDLALTVTISLLASLVTAVTIVPMLSARMINTSHNRLFKPIENFCVDKLHKIDNLYSKMLAKAMKHKKSIIFSSISIVISLIVVIMIFIGKEGYPSTDEGMFQVSIGFPVGTRVEYTDQMTKNIEEDIRSVIDPKDLEYILARVRSGRNFASASSDNRSSVTVRLIDKSKRKISVDEYMEKVREKMRSYPAKISVRSQLMSSGGMGGSDITLEIAGDDLERAAELGNKIIAVMQKIDGIREPEFDRDDTMPEISISINRDKASKMGLNISTIANSIKTAFGGTTSTRMSTTFSSSDLDVVVRLDEKDRLNVDDVMRMMIPIPAGGMVPISAVADFNKTYGPTAIDRKDNKRITSITTATFGRPIDKIIADLKNAIAKEVYVPTDFNIYYTGAYEDMQESFAQLIQAFILAFILVYAIMASQFESLIAPFIIMFSVPYGVAGTLLALVITGKTLSVVSGIGIIVLVGIVINNGIVLIDYMNQLILLKKLSPNEAALEAGPRRMRPVMMTTLTTVLGLFPMALGLSSGSELYGPLAVSVVGGLSVSSLFTLIVVPVAYSSIRNKFKLRSYEDKDAESIQNTVLGQE